MCYLSLKLKSDMATIIMNHRVKDFATWKPIFDSDKALRDGAGLTQLAIGQKSADPGMVYVV